MRAIENIKKVVRAKFDKIRKKQKEKRGVWFSNAEREALEILVEHAARFCGAGEDIIGAILYTGAFHKLEDADKAVVNLTRKIEGKNIL